MKDKDKVSYDEYLELVKQQVAIRTGTRVEFIVTHFVKTVF